MHKQISSKKETTFAYLPQRLYGMNESLTAEAVKLIPVTLTEIDFIATGIGKTLR